MDSSPIAFALADIKTLQFALFEENISPKKNTAVNLITHVQFAGNPLNKCVIVAVTQTFQQANRTLIKIQVECTFLIEENLWDKATKEQALTMPVEFMRHLTVICIGTMRGVLHTKTENTAFSNLLLPIIYVEDLVPSDVHFDLTEEE